MRWGVVGCVVLGLGVARAQEPVERPSSEPGYCDFVRGAGEAEAVLELYPSVFANAGLVNAGEAGGERGIPLGGPTPRLTAGVDYDFVGLLRARALRQRAGAECERYRALTALRSAVKQGGDVGARSALEARARVLEAALPEAARMRDALREELRGGRATLEELDALELRLDGLRSLAHDTARELARLSALPVLERPRLARWLRELREADERVEVQVGGLRETEAWSVRVRGGYDELIRVRQDLPLFGTVTLSYKLGAVSQSAANDRARAGRRRALVEDVDGVHQEVALLLRGLEAQQRVERGRLGEVTVLIQDLEQQLAEVKAMETARVRRYCCYLGLELMRLRAERAWLEAHVAEVGRFLAEEAP